jgi:hypothetical protein
MPPPTGTHTIADFKILAHVALKIPKKVLGAKITSIDEDQDSEYEENQMHLLPQPADLAPVWLQLSPSS